MQQKPLLQNISMMRQQDRPQKLLFFSDSGHILNYRHGKLFVLGISTSFFNRKWGGDYMKQRQDVRTKLSGTKVHVSDRAGFCTGTLKDFSRGGLCISDLPRKIHTKDGYFKVVVSRGPMNFNMRVKEKWETKDGPSTEVGIAINNAPQEWTSMVMLHEPRRSANWGPL